MTAIVVNLENQIVANVVDKVDDYIYDLNRLISQGNNISYVGEGPIKTVVFAKSELSYMEAMLIEIREASNFMAECRSKDHEWKETEIAYRWYMLMEVCEEITDRILRGRLTLNLPTRAY